MTQGVALITGGNGQLGRELIATVPSHWAVHAYAAPQLDVSSVKAVRSVVSILRPAVIVNAAAYTAVDRAERERTRAFEVNEAGVRNIAEAAKEFGSRVLHVSTDFVFDGTKSSPYTPSDVPAPLGAYGASKLAGEAEVTRILPERSVIIRTAWLYSAMGKNFVRTIIRLLQERDEVRVVSDQVGSPTYANGLAAVLWRISDDQGVRGIYHWADEGAISWYDFALAIKEESLSRGMLTRDTPVRPIPTTEYPTDARRPVYSALDSSVLSSRLGIASAYWRSNLTRMFDALPRSAVQ